MEKAEIMSEVNRIFIDVLENEGIALEEATIASDVDGWDSLTHIQLVVAVERHFKVRFTSKEIQGWANIGAMIACIAQRQR